jgi:hypothetical protein
LNLRAEPIPTEITNRDLTGQYHDKSTHNQIQFRTRNKTRLTDLRVARVSIDTHTSVAVTLHHGVTEHKLQRLSQHYAKRRSVTFPIIPFENESIGAAARTDPHPLKRVMENASRLFSCMNFHRSLLRKNKKKKKKKRWQLSQVIEYRIRGQIKCTLENHRDTFRLAS